MSLNNFIPQLWADTLLANLQKAQVYGALFNNDYEGTINRMGDTVKINAIGDITIYDYTKDTDLNPPQALTDAQTMLTISQAKYFNFEIDDVDAAQMHPEVMSEAMNWSAYRIADAMDKFFAGFYTDAIAANLVGTAAAPVTPQPATTANIGGGQTVYDYIVALGQYLNQQNVPEDGRWCVLPPWGKTYLMQDVRFTGYNTEAGRQAILTGRLDASGGNATRAYIGSIDGMDCYYSNNAPHLGGTVGVTGSQDVVLAGHTMAVTKAVGLQKTEAYRPPYRFGDAVKGLTLYGAKTVRPYALAAAFLQHP